MVRFLSWVTEVFIRTVIVHVWIFDFHSQVLLEVWSALQSAGMGSWSVQALLWRSVLWLWAWSTVISGLVSWRTFMCGWSAMWSMQCIMVRSMAIASIDGAWSSWAAPVVAALIPVLWPSVASMNHDDSSYDVFKNEIMIWIGFACLCLHSGVLNLI